MVNYHHVELSILSIRFIGFRFSLLEQTRDSYTLKAAAWRNYLSKKYGHSSLYYSTIPTEVPIRTISECLGVKMRTDSYFDLN